MAESDNKVINISKDVHNYKNTEEQAEEVKIDRKTEDTKETNNESTITLKSFKMMDDKSEDQSKIDNNVKTNRNQNYSEDIQEEVSSPKCYNCIYEVSEFLLWFCINIGSWCSNSFKRNCCFCCNKKIIKRKRGAFDEEYKEYWDGNVINEGDLARYSLPVCVDNDDEKNNEGFDEGYEINIENVDLENCNIDNKEDLDMNKGRDYDTKSVTHNEHHRSNSQGHCDVQSYTHGNTSYDRYNNLNTCDNDNKGVSGWSKGDDYDTKTVIHNNHHRHSASHDHNNDLNKCDNVNNGDIDMSKGIDHEYKTVTPNDNLHSYGHGHSNVHSSSHGITSDSHVSHVSHDYNTPTDYAITDTGYTGGDVGGCDTGGFSSDW